MASVWQRANVVFPHVNNSYGNPTLEPNSTCYLLPQSNFPDPKDGCMATYNCGNVLFGNTSVPVITCTVNHYTAVWSPPTSQCDRKFETQYLLVRVSEHHQNVLKIRDGKTWHLSFFPARSGP